MGGLAEDSQDSEEQSIQHRASSIHRCVNVLYCALTLPVVTHKLLQDSPAVQKGAYKAAQGHHTSTLLLLAAFRPAPATLKAPPTEYLQHANSKP